jgi:putative nucleotidyltransferase with HDIG domain
MRLPAAIRQLPPLSEALVAALEVIRDTRSQRSDLVRVLSLDQGMTGLFLRTVNSAYYGLPRRITSLDEAIGYLGYETVESTIFAISASKVLSKPIPAYQLEQGMLWQHSVGVAHGAQWIAKSRGLPSESDAYVAGLLHDVGKLVMDLLVDRSSAWETGMEQRDEHQSWIEVERLTTGHDHAEVGAVLVRTWNLPDPVVEATACHHKPADARMVPQLTAAVHVANAAALMAGIGLGIDGLSSVLEPCAIEMLKWSDRDMEDLIGAMQQAVATAKSILSVSW